MTALTSRRAIQRRKLHEDVAEYLLEDIRNGVYKVGEELPSERALMVEFAVGRPAIRESLAKLARMGMIEVRHGSRPKVCPVTVRPLLEEMNGAVKMTLLNQDGQRYMQEVRALFEAAVGRAVVSRISKKQIKKLEDIQAKSRKALADPAVLASLDVLFHRALGEVTENPLVIGIYDAFATWLLEQRLTNFKNPDRPKRSVEAHQRILDAVKARDPNTVEEAILAHLHDVQQSYWSIMEKK